MTVAEPRTDEVEPVPDLVGMFRRALPFAVRPLLTVDTYELHRLVWDAAGNGWEPAALAAYVSSSVHHYRVGGGDLMKWRLNRAANNNDDDESGEQ